MRPDVEARGRADGIKCICPGLGIARGRPAQHRQRAEPADARTADGLEPLTRLDRKQHGR
ncbi:MAG: hypothetical protein E6J13_01630 [Chloroflexi bacterium]|nr:MAG: hypothetical protein E6J13_01630 [Chloroflexota bacterium]